MTRGIYCCLAVFKGEFPPYSALPKIANYILEVSVHCSEFVKSAYFWKLPVSVILSCTDAFVSPSLQLALYCKDTMLLLFFFPLTFDVVVCIQLQGRQLPLKGTFGRSNLIKENHLNRF